MSVRSASPDDLPAIVEMLRALADEQGDDTAIDAPALAAAVFGADPVARVEVAIDATTSTVAGAAVWFPTYSTYLAEPGVYLQDLYVLPAHRSAGHGRALMEALAVRAGGRVEWSVIDGNERAAAFYRSLGARPHEGWTTWHWLPGDGQGGRSQRPAS